jgi:predicted permease
MENFLQDARYGLRQLRRSPGFATVAILTLALGVGLNSAVFRLLDAVILRTLSVEKPQQLFFPEITTSEGSDIGFQYPEFEAIRDHSQSFSSVFSFDTTRFLASMNGQTDYLFGQCVSANFYSALGVKPVLGRAFIPEDDHAGQPPVAVISYDYWQRRFAGDRGVLGKNVALKKIPFRVVGVAPPSFRGIELGDAVDIWIPMLYWSQVRLNDHLTVGIMGRLKPDATVSQATAELSVIDRQYVTQQLGPIGSSPKRQDLHNRKLELRSAARGIFSLPDDLPHELNILMAVAGFVLVIACANVANLQLARSISRSKEIATRLALGASRTRLMRHLLTESLLIALIGGVLGFVLANRATDLLLRFVIPGVDPLALNATVDAQALWFSAGAAILAGLLFGLVPAISVARMDAAPSLQAGGRSETGNNSQRKISASLVVVQVALCVSLLVGTGLMVRSLKKLTAVNPGFQRDHILMAFLYPTLGGYQGAKELNLYSSLQEQMNGAPGVMSASLSRFRLLSGGGGWHRRVIRPGVGNESAQGLPVHCSPVSPRFFVTMGIPLVFGRDFTGHDSTDAPRVAIISESLARSVFPNESPIGQRLEFVDGSNREQAEVVGTVRDVQSFNLRANDDVAGIYIPLNQAPSDLLGQAILEVRTTRQADVALASLRRITQAIDAEFPLARMSTQEEQASNTLTGERSLATLLSLFSGLALLLASIGLYGVIAYSTSRRTREIGIRVALGAHRGDVLRIILKQGLRLTLIGVGIGLVGAIAASRVLASQLFGVTSTDPLTFCGVVLTLAAVALAACYIPARRAASVDPVDALRYE